ncbi:unnamed protein product [Cuscuta campestris]|uniref:Pentacotripeptide-repeat region of PRORP domain-containing protein n=1 Tax=Cuscuta campestris TaxID=132261 RepID=A0A484KKK9_9ASTE|nr:unnamed protein product [Cuscuta campestris]
MEMPNFHSKKHLRYLNLNLFPAYYCSVPFRRLHKPYSFPIQAIPSAIRDLDLSIFSNKSYSGNSSSESPSKFYPILQKLRLSSYSSRAPSKCSVDSFSTCRLFSPSYVSVSRCFSVQYHHDKKTESLSTTAAEGEESKRNRNEIRNNVSNEAAQIIEIIRSDGEELSSKLSSVASSLDSKPIIMGTLNGLNRLRISGLSFFRILMETNPQLCRSGDICSLIINNCGCLGDYEAMISLLQEFKLQKICLNRMAFEFLPVSELDKDDPMESTRRVIDVLNKVGGSCRNSGISALIDRFCSLGSPQTAKFVMENTERTVRRYNILIRAMCKRGQIKEAHATIEEMRKLGCLPETNTYNYLIAYYCRHNRMSEVCTLLNAMKEKGFHPDAITLEAIICHSATRHHFGVAFQHLDLMVHLNIEPRPSTLSVLLNVLFDTNQHEKAYEFVNDMAARFRTSSNSLYNLLAKLHLRNGDPVIAKNILNEMVAKGLVPKHSIRLKCEAINRPVQP